MQIRSKDMLPLIAAAVGALLVAGAALAEPAGSPGSKDSITREQMQEKRAKLFKRIDADGDGAISRAEFMATGEKWFARLDRNSDGKITPDERPRNRAPAPKPADRS